MLKWVVNGSRTTYLEAVSETELSTVSVDALGAHTPNLCCKRKSTSAYAFHHKSHARHKEHQMTSTPLHCSLAGAHSNPLSKLDGSISLDAVGTPKRLTVLRSRENIDLLKTPQTQLKNPPGMPSHYASTLPTFDVEYSPSGLIPGPILALRGISIPDSYFEKPRYFPQTTQQNDPQQQPHKAQQQAHPHRAEGSAAPACREHELSLSSTRMGDVTLEHMIDAILESTRKERKLPRNCKSFAGPASMSPTYTAAEDPASDLHEFWHMERKRPFQRNRKAMFREREVRSPVVRRWSSEQAYQLKRQRAMRRKRKISKITSSVRSSAQKLLGVGATHAQADEVSVVNRSASSVVEVKGSGNSSPDSGHNSFSDSESYALPEQATEVSDAIELDATKRRLSFSSNHLI